MLTAQWNVDHTQGDANVVICAGIPGAAAADTRVAAANALFGQNSRIHTSTITSQWTPSPVHTYLLAESGVPMIELLDLEALSAEKVYEFAFVGACLKSEGRTDLRFVRSP